jgi:hypothetical protein
MEENKENLDEFLKKNTWAISRIHYRPDRITSGPDKVSYHHW